MDTQSTLPGTLDEQPAEKFPRVGPAPKFEDITLFDQETNEPFVFTASEQEFFWRQGFTSVPKFTPERRKLKREQKFGGKPLFNVKCRQCGKVGRVLQKPSDPRQVYCAECFTIKWDAHLEAHPEAKRDYEQKMAEAEAKALANSQTGQFDDTQNAEA